jgi:hypothetical protein
VARRFLPNKLAHAGRLLVCLPVGLVLGLTVFVALIQVGLFANPFAPRGIGELAQARSDRPGLRVLFVGNSFTFQNATPQLVHRLAAGDPGAPPLFAVQYAAPGWTLRDAAANRGLRSLIGQLHWNDVVLQEQSELLSLPLAQRVRQSYPYARRLNRRIAADHARTVLFQTWGYRDGDRQNRPEDSYVEMQTRLAQGYADLAWRLHATVAPVGVMWFTRSCASAGSTCGPATAGILIEPGPTLRPARCTPS